MKTNNQLTRFMLACGILAGPFYLVVGLTHAFMREGFDMLRHPLSMLSLGDLGWIQIANFLITGVLVLLGAMGLRRAAKPDKRWKRGTFFVTLYGICILAGGIFITDPSLGFPPGTPDTFPETFTWHALLHFIFGQLGFLSLIIATFVFGRYFAAAKQRGWMAFSVFTGAFFLASIFAGGAAMGAAWAMVALYVAVGLGWLWLSALSARSFASLK